MGLTNGKKCCNISWLTKSSDVWRSRVAGRARTIGNRVYPKRVSRVQIPPSPPNKKDTQSGVFFILCGVKWDLNLSKCKVLRTSACRRSRRRQRHNFLPKREENANQIPPSVPKNKTRPQGRVLFICFRKRSCALLGFFQAFWQAGICHSRSDILRNSGSDRRYLSLCHKTAAAGSQCTLSSPRRRR